MTKYIDLHTHSYVSDGSDSPSELVKKAATIQLSALALTDHDTIEGLREAKATCIKYNIEFVPGCEIAVRYEQEELHLLGLYVPLDSENFNLALKKEHNKRRTRNKLIIEKLQALKLNINLVDVEKHASGSSCGRPHIARELVRQKYVKNTREAFKTYLGLNKKAYVARDLLSPEAGIRLLKDAGATVFWAHPCLSDQMDAKKLESIIKKYKDFGLDGLEAFHPSHTRKNERLCLGLSKVYNLLLSGGSDYHGPMKPHCQLGFHRHGLRIPYKYLQKIKDSRD